LKLKVSRSNPSYQFYTFLVNFKHIILTSQNKSQNLKKIEIRRLKSKLLKDYVEQEEKEGKVERESERRGGRERDAAPE
jgi:hypothetical protein